MAPCTSRRFNGSPATCRRSWPTILERGEASREKGEPAVPDVRVIAYSSAPLAATSGFHPKLLTLLERRQLRVPSLAERPDDVGEIALFFLRQHARRIGAVVETISELVDEAAAAVPLAGGCRRTAERDRAGGDLRTRDRSWKSTPRSWTKGCRLVTTA